MPKSYLGKFFGILCILSLPWMFSGNARGSESKTVVVLETMTLPFLQETTRAFRESMSEMGYVDGKGVVYRIINANGNSDQARKMLDDALARETPDLVVSIATLASRVARTRLKETPIPQLFAIVADPVGEGFVSEIGQNSGSNITGRTHAIPTEAKVSLVANSISNLSKIRPFRVGLLGSTYPAAVSDSKRILAAAKSYPNLQFSEVIFDYEPGESGRVQMRQTASKLIKSMAGQLDGIWLATGPNELDVEFINLIQSNKIPILYAGALSAVKGGAMLSLISNADVNGRSTAAVAKAILDGTPANQIPVTRPDSFLAALNITTATQMGAVIPSQILELAKKNIFR